MLHLCDCGQHVLTASVCPNCGRTQGSFVRTAAAALLGLALGGCDSGEPQAKYGAAIVDEDSGDDSGEA